MRARIAAALTVFVTFTAAGLVWLERQLPRPEFGDEWRYLYYANNLLHGYFSPHGRVFLLNGPIYPLTLTPFVALGWLDGARYANAFWYGGAMAYAWLILRRQLGSVWTSLAIVPLGLYPPFGEHLSLLYTESLSVFLATAWIYHALNGVDWPSHAAAAGVCLAALVLTKVAFGPVVMAFLAVNAAAWFLTRRDVYKNFLAQSVLAFALCLPFLAYTHHLTGRLLYWSSAGANNFYWLTSPYPDEWGDWYHQGWVYNDPTLRAHHKEIFDRTTGLADNPDLSEEEQLFNLSTPESSDVFLERGWRNVREHPTKFIRNWCANVVRLFLDVPVTVRGTPVWNPYSVSHLPLLAWTGLVVVVARLKRIPPAEPWIPIFLFGLLTVAAYSVVSSMARFLIPIVPLWWLATCSWFGRIYARRA